MRSKHLPLKTSGLPIGSPPSLFLEHLVSVTEGQIALDFEAYEHRALRGTLRTPVKSTESSVTRQIEELLQGLKPSEELAVRTKVHRPSQDQDDWDYTVPFELDQIPAIDFCVTEFDDAFAGRVARALGFLKLPEMFIYASGRSFHGYVNVLVNYEGWVEFMGMMLLLNKIDAPNATDVRWCGHKLKRGYGTLRLSKNTERHPRVPAFVRCVQPEILGPDIEDEDYC